MEDYFVKEKKEGFTLKLWRGERMCLLGFDVDDPENDFVGFAIEYLEPGEKEWKTLRNRINFSYDQQVDGWRNWPSTAAPIQKFRWIHFPWEPKPGKYIYKVTKMHMPENGKIARDTSIEGAISLEPITYPGFLDVGFTRNFASSQAFQSYVEKYDVSQPIIPNTADEGLDFVADKARLEPTKIYNWLGFEGFDLLFDFLDKAVSDPTVEVDAMIYDLNEPDIVARLEALGPRLRAIIDDSSTVTKGEKKGHALPHSAESRAAEILRHSAGTNRVIRGHFRNLQHNKVFIAKRNGNPFKVIGGSTNFTFRGLYIQANNVLVFSNVSIARLFGKMFDLAFNDMDNFHKHFLASKWHLVKPDGLPAVHICFSPHKSPDIALGPVGGAIDQADSSVFYAIAFLSQTKSGATKAALDRLIKRPVFSYGVSDKKGSLELKKPDGSKGLVDFAYLAENSPEPFKSEWYGGRGINIHHKFVVTDFNKPTAKVFTGSSNLSPSGERNNGDHLIMIEDQKIAAAYAIEALRMFDHLHFRVRMKEAGKKAPKKLMLQKPTAISGNKKAWFDKYYVPDTQRKRDRKLFSS
jgi:phosphatidylserine/phosphatidylglycerophosphate/cardiolipin synthase-like enzyme